MPARPKTVDEMQIAQDILHELEVYGTDKGFQPVQNALFAYMKQKTPDRDPYDYTIGEFNYWFRQLVWARRIEVDPITRSIRAAKLIMIRRDT